MQSVDVERVGNLIGHMPLDLMGQFDEALRLHLAIWVGNRAMVSTGSGEQRRLILGLPT